MKGYKGFKKGLTCRGKQYAENTIFEEKNAEVCRRGIHFCESPLDVLDYYPLIGDDGEFNEIAEVEALDEVFTDDNRKFCTKKIKIGAKLSLKSFIEASVDFLSRNTETDTASGDFAQLAASGDNARLAASGGESQLAASGDNAKLAASGYGSKLAASGYGSKLAASGDNAQLAASGYASRLVASGDDAQLAASGNFSQLAVSGGESQLAASGDNAKLAASGDNAQLAASGYASRLVASGDDAQLAASGANSVIANIGCNGSAKGKVGTWITLAEYKEDKCVCVKSAQIDGEVLKEDTWFTLKDGEFQEVKA